MASPRKPKRDSVFHEETDMPALPPGLVKHINGRYYLRRRIPQDLLTHYHPKVEIQKSLGTSQYREALDHFRHEDFKLFQAWDEVRTQRAQDVVSQHLEVASVIAELTPEDMDRICQHYEAVGLAGDEKRREEGTYDISEITEYQEGYREAISVLKAAVAVGDIDTLGPILRQFLDLYNYQTKLTQGDYRRLAIAFGRAAIRTNEKLLRRYEGEDVPTPQVAPVREQHALSVVIKDYMDSYPKDKHAAMYRKVSAVLPMFLEVVGDKPIHTLRQTDINQYFALVHQLPPRWKDVCRQRKLSVKQLAALELGEIGPGTFDGTYKAAIAPFLKWARTNWQDRGFPTTLTLEMITYQGSRMDGEKHQRAFTQEELEKLFTGPVMAGLARQAEQAHKYWLPHLGLYTGARVNELCQLNPLVDILQEPKSGIWYLNITEDSEADESVTKTVKTATSKRKVPIHSQLIKLGFLDYVKRLKGQGSKLLFPGFAPVEGYASAEAQKWFRNFLRELGLRDETPGQQITGMHAFRSTFLNRAMNLGVVNAETITGHSGSMNAIANVQDGMVAGAASKVVRTYQGELDLGVKVQIIERVVWPDIRFIKARKSR